MESENGDGGGNGLTPDSEKMLKRLQDSKFLDQIDSLEDNLGNISSALHNLGEVATQRLEETENLAVHVLALQAIITSILRHYPVNLDEVKAVIQETTSGLSDEVGGSRAVHVVVEEILARVAKN